MVIWIKAGILTLNQLIDNDDTFLTYTMLTAQWQEHLLTTFGPAAFLTSETPKMLEKLGESFETKTIYLPFEFAIPTHRKPINLLKKT